MPRIWKALAGCEVRSLGVKYVPPQNGSAVLSVILLWITMIVVTLKELGAAMILSLHGVYLCFLWSCVLCWHIVVVVWRRWPMTRYPSSLYRASISPHPPGTMTHPPRLLPNVFQQVQMQDADACCSMLHTVDNTPLQFQRGNHQLHVWPPTKEEYFYSSR